MSSTTHSDASSWPSVHRALVLVLIAAAVVILVAVTALVMSRESASVTTPTRPAPAVDTTRTPPTTTQDCGTLFAPVAC